MSKEVSTIFYTDDDEDDRNFFKVAVHKISPSLQLSTFQDGNELMHRLGNPPPTPHILFLDLNMPGKNGYDVLKEIERSENTKGIPVVILSTSNDEVSVNTTKLLGANMYIPKPSSISSLIKAIKYALSIDWDNFDSNGDDFVYRIS